MPEFDEDLVPDGSAARAGSREALGRALGRLPEDYRQILTLRYEAGCSFEEIGQMMGRSPDAALQLWGRAMERLRQEWEGCP